MKERDQRTRKLPGWAVTLLAAVGLGTLILGVGSRLSMHAFALLTTGTGGFTVGGTATVIGLGAASGALGGLILLAARRLFYRWPPATSIVYWALLIGLTFRGLQPIDGLRAALFFPLTILFGIALQWSTWPLRKPMHGAVSPS